MEGSLVQGNWHENRLRESQHTRPVVGYETLLPLSAVLV
jgi:hypothetical protein